MAARIGTLEVQELGCGMHLAGCPSIHPHTGRICVYMQLTQQVQGKAEVPVKAHEKVYVCMWARERESGGYMGEEQVNFG